MNKKLILIPVALVVVLVVAGLLLMNSGVLNKLDMDSDMVNQNSETKSNNLEVKGPYTLSEVSSHNSESDCWSAINGKVYNLTDWINKHPGGSERIIGICGIDGSSAFNTQHNGQGEPASYLSSFYIGNLSN